jgi:hypothetical protein
MLGTTSHVPKAWSFLFHSRYQQSRAARRDRNRAGPQFLAIPSDRHLVRSWWHNQFLVPNKVVIELIHVAYEVQGLLAVQKNGGGVAPWSLPASIWMRPRGPGTGAPTGSSFMSTGTVLSESERDILLDKLVPVVGHNHMVGADIELDDPIAGTNGLAIDKCVGLLGAYRHLQFSWF